VKSQGKYILIDWGTTNFRAFLMGSSHTLIDKVEMRMGLLQVKNEEFAQSLEVLLKNWLKDYEQYPIYMAGMVGSAVGWHSVGYASAPASPKEVKAIAFDFTLPWGTEGFIFPGVACSSAKDSKRLSLGDSNSFERRDVMRGEEVQIFGLSKLAQRDDFFAILPGTHSKHAIIKSGCISEFKTYMTGELFDVLRKASILGKVPPETAFNSVFENRAILAFEQGLQASLDNKLSHSIFQSWSQRLCGNLTPCDSLDFLSGVLIGHELDGLDTQQVLIVSDETLSIRYAHACKKMGINAQLFTGEACFIAGMAQLIETRQQNPITSSIESCNV
jgi:2-dehydro-3-deoxygalactonokinase